MKYLELADNRCTKSNERPIIDVEWRQMIAYSMAFFVM